MVQQYDQNICVVAPDGDIWHMLYLTYKVKMKYNAGVCFLMKGLQCMDSESSDSITHGSEAETLTIHS